MKNLDLNALGVEEITKKEMVETDGGFLLGGIALAAVVAIINDWDNFERGLSGKPYKE